MYLKKNLLFQALVLQQIVSQKLVRLIIMVSYLSHKSSVFIFFEITYSFKIIPV